MTRIALVFDHLEVWWSENEDLRELARANSLSDFALEFERMFKVSVPAQEESNRRIYELIYTRPDLADAIKNFYLRKLFGVFGKRRRRDH